MIKILKYSVIFFLMTVIWCLAGSESELLFEEAVKDVGSITKFKLDPEKRGEFVIKPKNGNGEILVDFRKFSSEEECKEAYQLATSSTPVVQRKPPFEVGIEALWNIRGANFGLAARFKGAVLTINGSDVSPEVAKTLCESLNKVFLSEESLKK